MGWGFVYVMGNDSMPGIYKIGMTEKAPQERLEQLSSATAAPQEFWMAFFAQVENAAAAEKRLHAMFDHCRVNPNREFFETTLDELKVAFLGVAMSYHIHDVAFEPEAHIERRRLQKKFLIEHFMGQDPDPFPWHRHFGFD